MFQQKNFALGCPIHPSRNRNTFSFIRECRKPTFSTATRYNASNQRGDVSQSVELAKMDRARRLGIDGQSRFVIVGGGVEQHSPDLRRTKTTCCNRLQDERSFVSDRKREFPILSSDRIGDFQFLAAILAGKTRKPGYAQLDWLNLYAVEIVLALQFELRLRYPIRFIERDGIANKIVERIRTGPGQNRPPCQEVSFLSGKRIYDPRARIIILPSERRRIGKALRFDAAVSRGPQIALQIKIGDLARESFNVNTFQVTEFDYRTVR